MNNPSAYAREVERYLCQKNGGHLVRVVGPAFELVCGWASQGVPLKVALRGIDRCCERHAARGARRRPVRVEFCEADVLDAFDEWRRAVGAGGGAETGGDGPAPARRGSLPAHLERAIARLAHVRGVGAASTPLQTCVEDIIRELEQMLPTAARLRGDARAAVLARLARLDDVLVSAAIAALDPARAAEVRAEGAAELAAFGARMRPEAREGATDAAFRRLVREGAGLPLLALE